MNEYRQIRPECKEEFDRLHARINKRDEKLDDFEGELKEQGLSIARTSEDVKHVTKSISGLTKALWGLAAAMMTTLLGFVLWYIQSL